MILGIDLIEKLVLLDKTNNQRAKIKKFRQFFVCKTQFL
jgi:hypothetical protein